MPTHGKNPNVDPKYLCRKRKVSKVTRERYMSADECHRLFQSGKGWALESISKGTPDGMCAWMLVHLLLATGVRSTEARMLRCEDWMPDDKVIMVPRLKKYDVLVDPLPIPAVLNTHLSQYTMYMGLYGRDPILWWSGNPMSRTAIKRVFKRALDRAGLPSHHSPKSCRHSVAYQMLRETNNLHAVQLQLGHTSIGTTAANYAHRNESDMRAACESVSNAFHRWQPNDK
jgi:integrase